ncbi:MAG: DNA-formamidopyrimidine glycosylase family protein [Pseudomonadota bacterium]
MPEGPTIILLCEQVARLAGQRIEAASGNAKIDMARLAGQTVKAFRSWGKHFLIELPEVAVRVHFLMFGSYAIDSRKEREPRLRLTFSKGEINFYSCAIRLVEGPLDATYDWSGDVMAEAWNPAAARKKLRGMPDAFICDALLDQNVFAGVGNIIKNEVLFRARVHPLSTVDALPAAQLDAIIGQARQYSFEFLEWRRAGVLRQHWQVHNKGTCPNCGGKLTRAWLGKTDRRSFFCERCQKRYGAARVAADAQRKTRTRTRAKTKVKSKAKTTAVGARKKA